jgi:hypothetical protein
MVGFVFDLQTFELEHGIDEYMVVLGGDGAGGRLGQSCVGF